MARKLYTGIIDIGAAIGLSHVLSSSSPLASEIGYSHPEASVAAEALVELPHHYKQQFMHYATVDCPTSGIIRQMYVDRPSLDKIKAERAVPSGIALLGLWFLAIKVLVLDVMLGCAIESCAPLTRRPAIAHPLTKTIVLERQTLQQE